MEQKPVQPKTVSPEVEETKADTEPSTEKKGSLKKSRFRLVSSNNSKPKKQKNSKFFRYLLVCILLFHVVNNIYYFYDYHHVVLGEPLGNAVLNGLYDFASFPNMFRPNYMTNLSLTGILLSIFVIGCFFFWDVYRSMTKRNQRIGEEYGSARKGDIYKEARKLNSSFNPKPERRIPEANMILSENIQVDMDTRHTMLNDNVFVVGGSGSGKTRFFVKPNALQMYCNYIIIDPKGSVAEEIGNAFYQNGYEIRYLNLVDLDKSMGYNPFEYFNEPLDVQKFVNNLIENTKDSSAKGGDEFFVKAENTWMCAVIYYIMATCEGTDRCNMNTLMLLLDHSNSREEDSDDYMSEVDTMFQDLENQLYQKNHGRSEYGYADLAIRNYKVFKMGAGKTAKSILISVGVRLSIFNQGSLQKLMSKDELHLEHFGNPMVKSKNPKYENDLTHDIDRKTYEIVKRAKYAKAKENNEPIEIVQYEDLPKSQLRKIVLFVIVSDNEPTLSFLSSIILQQLYTQMYMAADARKDKKLPIHTRIINDEFATSGKQPDYSRKISTMRSREISTCVIVQGISQIKSNSLYGDEWEAIFENCDTTLFLGSKGPSTLDLISKLAGKETDKVITTSETKGSSSSFTRQENLVSRDVYDYSELSRLHISLCLVHIKGHHIYEDKKYDVKHHPNVGITMDANVSEKEAEKYRFDIVTYANEAKLIDLKRDESVREEFNESVIDMDSVEALQKGEILSSENDLVEISGDCYFSDDMLISVEEDIERLEGRDLDMTFLPS